MTDGGEKCYRSASVRMSTVEITLDNGPRSSLATTPNRTQADKMMMVKISIKKYTPIQDYATSNFTISVCVYESPYRYDHGDDEQQVNRIHKETSSPRL
jgi:hypothetical protein